MPKINPILSASDSYKFSHCPWQYPPGTEYVYSYIESRGGDIPETVFFGSQYLNMEYLSKPFTRADINEAEELIVPHGEPFNRELFDYILNVHGGYWPVKIRAVSEGTVMPTKNLLLDITNTNPKVPMTSFLETEILRSIWYGTTVASKEFQIKRLIRDYLKETADDDALKFIGLKHNDFGARGVSSHESAIIGGLAHLICFTGTDNIPALKAAKDYYDTPIAGYSIPAAEHSTMTSWNGQFGELDAMRNMRTQFAKPGKIVAVVSDSYDIYNAVENYWCGILLNQVKDSGATVVIRPDSGDPILTLVYVIQTLLEKCAEDVRTNSKGYAMLPPYFRVIQGDGVNYDSIKEILQTLKVLRISTDNICFGMGGAMLQKMDRDTMKFAMKCSAVRVNGVWRDVYKQPITDPGKNSKRGLLELVRDRGEYKTLPYAVGSNWRDYGVVVPRVIYDNHPIEASYESLETIRARVDAAL